MRFEEHRFENLKYVIRYPDHFEEGKKYPVIFLLHGAGGRGDDLNVLKNNPFFLLTNEEKDFPFVTVAPLCSANTWFDLFEQLERLALSVPEMPFADKKRICCMGPSMGGYGTWQLAMSQPELFAAIVPICGGGMYWNAGRLAGVPVWAFHGAKDKVVFLEESQKMVDAVNKNGGSARLTIYPDNEHNAWSDTYTNPEVFAWLLAQENKNIITDENYHSPELYG
ncbi:MAG: prolyl oligopeptidase family serine peptidase [Oscillospiraceae bacterium]|nr:prolyl oligopeptidase family serine peptidase [Oscillospiraceae bacterium]